ncbi:MAG: branched-chain amino acid ABC transporter substrate-binding protein [Caldilineaceae bacterium]|nr:branched-chain amino acid ABC transporter substrate-binding protein [Caldilineaceae bacterium]
MRIRTLFLTVFVIAALVVTACAPAPQPAAPAGQATEAATEAAATEEAAAGGFTCDDPLGCVEVKAGDPIKVGYALVVSGANESLGVDSVRGIELAVADVGGELLGHPVQIVGEDDGCSPEGGQASATKLASDKSIVAVIGTSCSSAARVGVPILSEAGMSIISPSNTAPDLTDPASHSPGYFRTAHNDKVQGRVVAEFAYNEKGLRRAATIHDGSVYAQGLVNAFAENFKALGGEVVSEQAVNVNDTDMRPVLTTIAAEGPDLVYFPVFTAEGGFIASQAKEVPGLEEVTLIGSDGMFSQDFVSAAGEAALGMYLSSPDFSAFGDQYGGFLQKHLAEYGEPPLSAFHAHAYDAFNMIAAGIQQVAVEDGGTLYIPRTALREAIGTTANFQGLTGNINCDEYGDCADPKIAIYEVTDIAAWDPNVTSPMKIYPQ